MSAPILNHQDWMNIVGGAWMLVIVLCGALFRWVMKVSGRVTALEAHRESSEKFWSDVVARLARIEDKIDRKVDK